MLPWISYELISEPKRLLVNTALNDIGYQLPFWRNQCRNSAGDLDPIPEVIIEDPGAKDMERLFGSDLES